jgi:hypothetical protein
MRTNRFGSGPERTRLSTSWTDCRSGDPGPFARLGASASILTALLTGTGAEAPPATAAWGCCFLLLPSARGHGALITWDLAATHLHAGGMLRRDTGEPGAGLAVACAAGLAMIAVATDRARCHGCPARVIWPPRRTIPSPGGFDQIPWLITVAA